MKRGNTGWIRKLLVVSLAAAVGGALGCGNDGVLGPQAPSPDTALLPPVGAVLTVPGEGVPAGFRQLMELVTWEEVAEEMVDPAQIETVEGSRYSVTFGLEALTFPTMITIKERDPDVVDVDLGPDGLEFNVPVTLEIDYSGTANDPSSPDYHGLPPRLFWYNPETGNWKVIPGTDDPKALVYRAQLRHFSRYAMGDGAGWDPDHRRNNGHTDEIQWH